VQINDAVALVTGGASGLGLATTRRLLDAGAQVVVLDIKGEDVIRELGDRARFAPADVTDENAVTAAFDIAESLGPLRIVINCAGTGNAIKTLGKDGPFPLAAFRKVVEINLIGTFNVLRLGAERMAQHDLVGEERGVIVNTASVAAYDGQIGQAAYSASKGGVVGMTLPIARPGQQADPRRDDRARPVRHPAAGRPARAGPRVAGQAGATPQPVGKPGRIRRARGAHRREPDAQRRSHPTGWSDPDGPAVTPSYEKAPAAAGAFRVRRTASSQ
jgi:NADP-dependent 3-hydroxy acid dehydrogenase YdfG